MVTAIRCSAIAVACMIAQTGAYAQGPAPSPSGDVLGSSATPSPATERDIIVTATRRIERLENVPAAVIALKGAQLDSAGIHNVRDLAFVAPGVSMAPSSTYTHPTIRGITTTFSVPGSEPNVTVYFDGFYHV